MVSCFPAKISAFKNDKRIKNVSDDWRRDGIPDVYAAMTVSESLLILKGAKLPDCRKHFLQTII